MVFCGDFYDQVKIHLLIEVNISISSMISNVVLIWVVKFNLDRKIEIKSSQVIQGENLNQTGMSKNHSSQIWPSTAIQAPIQPRGIINIHLNIMLKMISTIELGVNSKCPFHLFLCFSIGLYIQYIFNTYPSCLGYDPSGKLFTFLH